MTADVTILLLGANGQVGHELHASLTGRRSVVPLTSAQLNLERPDEIRSAIRQYRPHIIINAAAYTAVDRAESDMSTARIVNATAPGILAEEARRTGAVLIHYSTDFVFDGETSSPYSESDPPNPLNVYGRTKLEGELAIQAVDTPALIFRTSWVYAQRGKNFLLTMRKVLRSQAEVKVVNDQFGAPTWARAIARSTVQILAMAGDDCREFFGPRRGVYHMTAGGRTSWHGFACRIARDLESDGEKIAVVTGVPSSAYRTTARRPANSVLDNHKLQTTFGQTLPDWHDMLAECLAGHTMAGRTESPD